jgi:hypothetical protein
VVTCRGGAFPPGGGGGSAGTAARVKRTYTGMCACLGCQVQESGHTGAHAVVEICLGALLTASRNVTIQ